MATGRGVLLFAAMSAAADGPAAPPEAPPGLSRPRLFTAAMLQEWVEAEAMQHMALVQPVVHTDPQVAGAALQVPTSAVELMRGSSRSSATAPPLRSAGGSLVPSGVGVGGCPGPCYAGSGAVAGVGEGKCLGPCSCAAGGS